MDLESGTTRWRGSLSQPSSETDKAGNESGGSKKKVVARNRRWNKMLAGISTISLLLVDPLYLYTFVYDNRNKCLDVDHDLIVFYCTLRSLVDIFYFYDVILQYKHCSNLHRFLSICAALPIPQVVLLRTRSVSSVLSVPVVIFFSSQFTARIIKLGKYYIGLTRHSRLLPENPGYGAAVNVLFCMLASNVLGAVWYYLTVLEVSSCWLTSCLKHDCDRFAFYCRVPHTGDYSFLNSSCPLLQPDEIKQPSDFNFGMFLEALESGLLEKQNRQQRLLYGFWWGLRNLSSLGQNIRTSNDIYEISFAVTISLTGLFLFAMLIHSIQNYAKSILATEKRRHGHLALYKQLGALLARRSARSQLALYKRLGALLARRTCEKLFELDY